MLLTTQYLDEADQLAGDIVVVDHGIVIASGAPEELKEAIGVRMEVSLADGAHLQAAAKILRELTGSLAAINADELRVSVTLAHPLEATLAWSAVLLALFMPLAARAFSTHGQ